MMHVVTSSSRVSLTGSLRVTRDDVLDIMRSIGKGLGVLFLSINLD